jgi:NAD(P)H-hydrate epimerase
VIEDYLKQIYRPAPDSHKGENGKVLIIAGSKLFHAASIWPAEIASKIVDMVFYSSVDENNEIVKGKFANGIVVPRNRLEDYIKDADSILIGPGLPRVGGMEEGDPNTKKLTESLFAKYPEKKWVVDGGSLQVIDPSELPKTAIISPHQQEFAKLFQISNPNNQIPKEIVWEKAKEFGITILLKGPTDIVCDSSRCEEIAGGNAGMTKGGTGDVLAGLLASLYAKNDSFTSAVVGSFINKKAGESLFAHQGLYFNATDLVNEIPIVMKKYLY